MISPHQQAFCFDETLDVAQQQLILKDAARQHNRIDSVLSTQYCNRVAKSFRNSTLKRAGNFTSISAAEPVTNHPGEQRAEIKFTA